MEANSKELGGHASNQSTVSTSLDSIDIDSFNVESETNIEWLTEIINNESIQDISEKTISMVNSESKLINTFYKNKCILSNKFYLSKNKHDVPELLSVINLGSNIESHPNVVHGGFSATIVDNCLGVLAHQIFKLPVTKTLNLSYKKPIQPNSTIVVFSKLKYTEDGENFIRGDRATLVSEIYDINHELLLSSEAIFVDISNKVKK
ncbi:hypothetical protein FG386_000488 [Cryptosporidium ryanae]|uniref:uncharacterized protein n=1 Tax=Cryptosporidium ryanae TaxID=515981 RepID=UPI003519E708|nr:hypothetical protein FG386_000488 [Cryptosporidium ryanae]